MIAMSEKKGLTGRDLINIGIYSAIYFVISLALAFTGLIPVMLLLLSSMYGLICGIPFMMFLTRVKKPGMILIMSAIMGILMFVTGMTWMPAGVFPLWACGNYLPLFLQREQ